MHLRYSDEAINDLKRLHQFIAEHNPSAAQRISAHLIKTIDELLSVPHLGKKVSHAPNPEMVRDLITGAYIVRYVLLPNEVIISRIWHQRESWK